MKPYFRRTWIAVFASIALVTPKTAAQRETAEVKIKDLRAAIEYGAVLVGRHSREALEVGQTWRMGRNEASVISLELPLLAGDEVVAPGSYRIFMTRDGEEDFRLGIAAGELGLRPEKSSGDVTLIGKLESAPKPTAKLEVALRPEKPDIDATSPVVIVVCFGADRLDVRGRFINPTKCLKSSAWTCQAFAWPSAVLTKRLESGSPTPIARLTRADPSNQRKTLVFNLLLSRGDATLAPLMEAPTASFGFGAPKPLNRDHVVKTKVSMDESQCEEPKLRLESFRAKREGVVLDLAFGAISSSITIPDPFEKKHRAR